MHRRARPFLAIAAAALVAHFGGPHFGGLLEASAQEVILEVKDPKVDPKSPEAKGATPEDKFNSIRGKFSGVTPGLAAKDFILKQEEAEPKVSVEASRAVTYPNSDEPMTLVILIEGDTSWMGNETYIEEGNPEVSRTEGAFTGLGAAIDAFATAGPAKSQGTVITYGDAAVVRHPMGDLTKISGSSLGSQEQYSDLTVSLVIGLEEAWKTLTAVTGTRRVLVVIGNGSDTQAAAAEDVARVVGDLKKANIETYSIRYSNDAETDAQGVPNMKKIGYTKSDTATSRDHLSAKAKNIVELIGATYYVDFPGATFGPWDGDEHTFIPSVGGEDLEEMPLTLPVADPPKPPEEGGLWWLWLIIGLAVVAVIVIIIIVARRKPAAPPPPVMEMDVPPPEPAGPKKTVMFNLNVGSEYPVVGWIVPLSGPNQFQTFKLLHGETKIGTGGDAHIIIDDGFMSTIHCEIVCKQSGFILQDGGSTNGSFVNDRRISEHELVDNDQFILGKTPFKFKSIN